MRREEECGQLTIFVVTILCWLVLWLHKDVWYEYVHVFRNLPICAGTIK